MSLTEFFSKGILTRFIENDNVFFIVGFLYGGTASYTVMLADGAANSESVQQRRDIFGFRQENRLL